MRKLVNDRLFPSSGQVMKSIKGFDRRRQQFGLATLILATLLFVQSVLPGSSFGQDPAPTQPPITRAPGGLGAFGGIVPGGQYPSQEYYTALELYRAGEMDRAAEMFDASLRGARLDANGRWIDSIPSLAMLGECYWHLGDLQQAKVQQDKVFEIVIKNRGWLGRTNWVDLPQNAIRPTPAWLWNDARAVSRVSTASKVSFRAGNPLTAGRIARGGRMEEETFRRIDIVEVMRCIGVASFRRRLIVGELSKEDRLSESMLDACKYPAELNVPLARTLIGSVRTTGHFANAASKPVIDESNRNAFFNNRAHSLTPIVMMTKAWTITGEAKPAEVADLAVRTANVSAALEQPEWIGEAMQLAAGSATQENARTVANFSGQVGQSYLRRSRLVALHCLVAAADASITAGDIGEAQKFLTQAKAISVRRDVILPRLTAYGAYVTARLAAHSGATIGSETASDADKAIGQVRAFAMQHRTRRKEMISIPKLFQVAWIRSNFGAGWGGRSGDAILQNYTRNPSAADWQRDPVDSLGMILADRSVMYQARAELAAAQGYADALLARTDDMLAYRFLRPLPLSGRACNLRMLSERSDAELSKAANDVRTAAGRPMAELVAMVQKQKPDDAAISNMETQVAQIALSRLAVPQVSLPTIVKEKPIGDLPPRTGLLVFVKLDNDIHAILGADDKLITWKIANAKRLSSEVSRLLKAIGVVKSGVKRIPKDESWKGLAVSLRKRLLPDDNTITTGRFDRLIIVPDGPLWYLPFEILPIGEADSELMNQTIAIKYAPTPGIAVSGNRRPPINRSIGLTGKQFFNVRDPKDDASIFQSVADALESPVRLPDDLEVTTGALGDYVGHLAVANVSMTNLKNPLSMSIAPYDSKLPSGKAYGWLRYPPRAPASVVMMGTRTPVGIGQMGNGNEIFQTLTALHVAGVDDVLMSRWAVGGDSSATLLRELLQELPFEGLNGSWERAKQVLQATPLDPTREPLLSKGDAGLENLSGKEPLFWAGYLMSGGVEK